MIGSPPLEVIDLERLARESPSPDHFAQRSRAAVLVGVSEREVPPDLRPVIEALTLTLAPAGPGRAWVAGQADDLDKIISTVSKAPQASGVLASLLPLVDNLGVEDGLLAESLAYSMLLGGSEFQTWLARRGSPRPDEHVGPAVALARTGEVLTIRLDRPTRHNAFNSRMRDDLVDGLQLAIADPSIERVLVQGAGRSFCSGGDLDEFGTTPDIVTAHRIRTERSPARLVDQLRERVVMRLHGACIGAGVEIASFAGRVEAMTGTWFLLPELSMGLIPGAGGTVGLTRRVGRWRTAYLAMTGRRLDVDTALTWGLVDHVVR